jgi:methyltransferase (TIGR00027 family)
MAELNLPHGVGLTGLVTAYARAQETRRPDRLFADVLAVRVVETVTGTTVAETSPLPRLGPAREDNASPLWRSLQTHFAVRTPYYDNYVLDAIAAGAEQLVILAAGLDARAYRLPLPAELPVYELDTAEVLDFKQAVLDRIEAEPVVRRVPIAQDLRGDWPTALTNAGFDPQRRTAWLAEGLLMYLTPESQHDLFAAIADLSAPGSTLATETFNRCPHISDVTDSPTPEELALANSLIDHYQAPAVDNPVTWFESRGFTGRAIDSPDLIASASRPPVPLFTAGSDPLHLWLISGVIT